MSGYGRAVIFNAGGQVVIPTLGGITNNANDVNRYGVVVGESQLLGEQILHAYRYDGTTTLDLGTLGGLGSAASAINSQGQIVGWSYTEPGQYSNPHAFVWTNGSMHDLTVQTGGALSIATDINDQGIIIGTGVSNIDGQQRGYIHGNSVTLEIAGLAGKAGIPVALNNRGAVVGYSTLDTGLRQAFVAVGGETMSLGALGEGETYPTGINDAGTIVGFSDIGADQSHAFLFKDGATHDLNALTKNLGDWTLVSATAINERDQIAAVGLKDGVFRAFQLTPIQKVSLEFGQTVPFELNTKQVPLLGFTYYVVDQEGTMNAAAYSNADQQTILDTMRGIFEDSGITNIEIEIGSTDADTTKIYFSDKTTSLAGYSLGVDRFNQKPDDALVVFQVEPKTDAETATHEIAHSLGARHVDPGVVFDPNTGAELVEIMSSSTDHPLGAEYRFLNEVSLISDINNVLLQQHNPVFHLRHYVDGVSTLDLLSEGIDPGNWDLDGDAKYLFRLTGLSSARILYNVDVLGGSAGDVSRLVGQFESISLEELGEMAFVLEEGESLSVFGSSVLNGDKDIVLATGSPMDHSNLFVSKTTSSQFMLLSTDGVSSIANTSVTVTTVPEPTAAFWLVLFGVLVSTMRSRTYQKTIVV